MGEASTADFFISRAGPDREIAKLIAELIREADKTPWYQDEDFGHASFMRRMEEGFESQARIVALLSPSYQRSEHCRKEYNFHLTDDPNNIRQRLIVLRVGDCVPGGNLRDIAFTDLVKLLFPLDRVALAAVVRVAIGVDKSRAGADIAAIYRRQPRQILHPNIAAVRDFAGREPELEALSSTLWIKGGRAALTNSKASAAAMKGGGGVGKSVLAQEYAWRNRDRYHGVWWVRAETKETLEDDLIDLGSRFISGLKDIGDRAKAAHLAIQHLAEDPTDKPWLIVFDNVETPGAIAKLTPAANAHTLITTRWQDWHGHAEEVSVGVFPRAVAVEYLMAHARKGDPEAAGRLADDLGCLPLALAHARSYCWGMNWGFDQYRAYLPELIRKAPRDAAYPAAVFATFSLAIDKAAQQCPEAEKLMGLFAFLAPDKIPLGLFTSPSRRGAGKTLEEGDSSPLVGEDRRGGIPTYAVAPPTPSPSPQGGGESPSGALDASPREKSDWDGPAASPISNWARRGGALRSLASDD